MRIGVVSDTHIPRRAKEIPMDVLKGLEGVDLILHAGDILTLRVLDDLKKIAPVTAVHGNVDYPEVYNVLPRMLVIEAGNFKIGLIHGDGQGLSTELGAIEAFEGTDVNCIVYGHSHIAKIEMMDGKLMFNPGSPTDKRLSPEYSYGILDIDDEIKTNIIYF